MVNILKNIAISEVVAIASHGVRIACWITLEKSAPHQAERHKRMIIIPAIVGVCIDCLDSVTVLVCFEKSVVASPKIRINMLNVDWYTGPT